MDTLLSWLLPLLLLLGHTANDCAAEEAVLITGLRGGSVHLSPILASGFRPREVFWRHLSPVDHMVASYSRGSSDTSYQSCFYGRVRLLQNFTLEISELRLGDFGMFTCQMVDTHGLMKLHRFFLSVYEAVAKPEVQIFMSRESRGCSAFLQCHVSKGSNVTYSWRIDGGEERLPNDSITLLDHNRLLKIHLTPTYQNVSFICRVTNAVSQEHVAVTPWSSCEDTSGGGMEVRHGNVLLCIAAMLVVLFAAGMFCVFLATRGSGKPLINIREENMMHGEDVFLPTTEEAHENEEANTPPNVVVREDRREPLNEESLHQPTRVTTFPGHLHVLHGKHATYLYGQTSNQQTQESPTDHNEEDLSQLTGYASTLQKKTTLQQTEAEKGTQNIKETAIQCNVETMLTYDKETVV